MTFTRSNDYAATSSRARVISSGFSAPGLSFGLLGFIFLLSVGAVWSTSVSAENANSAQRGLEIMEAVNQRDDGFTDSKARMRMVLKNSAGDTATRELTVYTMEVPGDGDKSVIFFESPLDVEGTALLTWAHPLEDDDQWLFLPSLNRVKRVSSTNKSGPFMGSEFSFEDLGSQETEKYTYEYLREDSYNGRPVHVINSWPAYSNSGYTRLVSMIDIETLNILQVEYYDRNDALLKTLVMEDYRRYYDQFWRPHLMTMVNHQTQKETTLEWGEYSFKNGLKESFFNKNKLKML